MQEFKALLAKYNAIGVEAFFFLMTWEDDEQEWKGTKENGTGFATFADMLNRFRVTHDGSIEYHRLANFREGFGKLASTAEGKTLGVLEAAKLIGPEAVMLLAPVQGPSGKYSGCSAVEGIVRDMTNKSEGRGLQVSAQMGTAMVREHYLPPKVQEAAPPTRKDALAAAQERIAELEALVAKKDREIERLKAKLDKARAVPVKAKHASSQPAASAGAM